MPERDLDALRDRLAHRHPELVEKRLHPTTADLDAALEQRLGAIGELPPAASPQLAHRLRFTDHGGMGGLEQRLELPFPRRQLFSGWLVVNPTGARARPAARLLMPLHLGSEISPRTRTEQVPAWVDDVELVVEVR